MHVCVGIQFASKFPLAWDGSGRWGWSCASRTCRKGKCALKVNRQHYCFPLPLKDFIQMRQLLLTFFGIMNMSVNHYYVSMNFIVFLHFLHALEGTSFSEDSFSQGFKTIKENRQLFTVLVTTPSLIYLIFSILLSTCLKLN